ALALRHDLYHRRRQIMKTSFHVSPYPARNYSLAPCAILLLLFAVTSLISTGSLRAQDPAVRVEMFSFSPDGYVGIENRRGTTRVNTWDKPEVHVIVEKRTTTGTPLAPSELVLASVDNTISILCKETGEPGRINLTVYIPRRSHLQITGGELP